MAQQDGSEARTHEPSARRLRQARERGQVAASPELAASISLLGTLLGVVALAPWAAKRIADFQLLVDRVFEALTLDQVQATAVQGMLLLAQLSAIPLGIATALYMLVLWLQTGTVLSLDPVKPQLERMDPVEGLKRTFSLRALVRLLLVLVKATIITIAAVMVCLHTVGDAVRVSHADAGAALVVANSAIVDLMLWCGGLFVLIGLLDYVYQRWQFLRDMRMTTSELRREHRDTQGDGKLKSQRKGMAQEPLPREQLEMLHLASLGLRDDLGRVVVLVYRPKHYRLPLCLVRGAGEIGTEITRRLQQLRKPLVTEPALVAALYGGAHPGAPVPAPLLDQLLPLLRRDTP